MADIAASTGAWLLTYLLHSSALLGVTLLATRTGGRRLAALAEPLWYVALLGGLITASLQLFALPSHAFVVLDGTTLDNAADVAQRAWSGRTVASTLRDLIATLLPFLGGAWALIASVRLLALMRSHTQLQRILADRTPVVDARIMARMRSLARSSKVRVSISRLVPTPMVVRRHELCLPEQALSLSVEEVDAILAHEAAHIVRHDPAWLLLAVIVERVLWIQPLNAMALAQLRTIAESACDDWALARTKNPLALAEALSRVTQWLVSGPRTLPATMIGMASRESAAIARIRRILDAHAERTARPPVVVRVALAALLLPIVVVFAPGITMAAAASGSRYTISARDDAGPFTITMDRGRVLAMTIDGEPVSKTRLRQHPGHLHVDNAIGRRPLDITLTPAGGIRWSSRPPRTLSDR